MKHMLVLLMAAMLVFSFAGCTQYDFSALEDFWQNQNEETEKAQEIYGRFERDLIDRGVEIVFNTDCRDLIIEDGEKLFPIEIKSGQTFSGSMLEGLNYWRSLDKSDDGMLIYGGADNYTRSLTLVRSWSAV